MSTLEFDETQSRHCHKRKFGNRILFAIGFILLLFILLFSRMVYLQLLNHEQYFGMAEGNRINVEPIAPERGKIFDRNMNILADNQPVFSLLFHKEHIEDIEQTLEAIQQIIPSLSEQTIDRFKNRYKQTSKYKSLSIAHILSEEEAAKFAVNSYLFDGVTLDAKMQRTYPYGSSGVHFLGYVGRINQQDKQKIDRNRYRGTDIIGRIGLEKFYEERLLGYPGLKKVEKSAQGRVLQTLETISATPGEDLVLTIDINLQKYIEDLLDGRRGSVVAIDPKNGEILAFVSSPTYDPNLFVDGISHQDYNNLLNNPDKPLINRASNGQYPPGSTTKPFIGLGALEQNITTMTKQIFDPGYFEFQDKRYRNWRRTGHGFTDLRRSIVESVDTYYYKMSLDMGIDMMHDIMRPFGFGEKTGVDLPSESRGILPSQEWKMATHGQAWYRGETIISSIGQGYNLVTPLQLAKATAVLANRGRVVTPHFLVNSTEQAETQIPIKNRENWEYVIKSMEDTVHTPAGTAWSAGRHLKNIRAAGKTGTAQVFSLNDTDYKEDELDKKLHDHSLFIGFAPVARPKIAISVIIENAGGGGRVAAPIAMQAINFYLNEQP